LFSVAGVAVLALNWQNLSLMFSGKSPTKQPFLEATPILPSGNATEELFETAIGDEISNGQPDAGAGLIEAPGSKDVYTFAAEAGQDVYIQVVEPPSTSDTMYISLVDDINTNVFSSCMQCGDPGTITLDRGGTYKLIVGNDDPTGAGYGAYRIKLWDVPPPDAFEIGLDDLVSRDEPDSGAGYIENPGSTDEYTFTAEAGQTVYFQVVQAPQSSDTINWGVFDEAENTIFDICLQCGDPGLFTLDRGGAYNIYVGNQSGAATGTYQFKIWGVPPADEFEINIGDPIAKNTPGQGSGFIEVPGAHDIYSFTATPGQAVTFKVKQQLLNYDPIYWVLEDEQGNEVFNTCLPCGDPGSLTLERGGLYTLTVGSDNNAATGAYELEITSP
jgi:hypothetical protein